MRSAETSTSTATSWSRPVSACTTTTRPRAARPARGSPTDSQSSGDAASPAGLRTGLRSPPPGLPHPDSTYPWVTALHPGVGGLTLSHLKWTPRLFWVPKIGFLRKKTLGGEGRWRTLSSPFLTRECEREREREKVWERVWEWERERERERGVGWAAWKDFMDCNPYVQ